MVVGTNSVGIWETLCSVCVCVCGTRIGSEVDDGAKKVNQALCRGYFVAETGRLPCYVGVEGEGGFVQVWKCNLFFT